MRMLPAQLNLDEFLKDSDILDTNRLESYISDLIKYNQKQNKSTVIFDDVALYYSLLMKKERLKIRKKELIEYIKNGFPILSHSNYPTIEEIVFLNTQNSRQFEFKLPRDIVKNLPKALDVKKYCENIDVLDDESKKRYLRNLYLYNKKPNMILLYLCFIGHAMIKSSVKRIIDYCNTGNVQTIQYYGYDEKCLCFNI